MEEPASRKKLRALRFRFNRRDVLFILLGVLLAFSLRFILVDSQTVHHHANFALYVNDVRDQFDNFTFYEEVSSCTDDQHNNPKTRVHMHDSVNHVVHVHDAGATWGHFFANLGYTLGDRVLVTDDGVFADGVDGASLTFILNGQPTRSVANRAIGSEDTLFINYGNSSEDELTARYDQIRRDAGEYNHRPDPSSCSGGDNESLGDRFRRNLGISGVH